MALPVTGPFDTAGERNFDLAGSYKKGTHGFKQAKPFDRVLPYVNWILRTLAASKWGNQSTFGGFANATVGHGPWYTYAQLLWKGTPITDNALNVARARFLSKAGPTAEMAVNLAERRQAMKMISSRLLQLYAFSKALKRGDLTRASRILGVKPSRKKDGDHRVSKGLSGLWLEFHFGWAPLIGDIFSAIEILDSAPPPFPIKGTALIREKSTFIDGSAGQWSRRCYMTNEVRAWVGGAVRVTNPNLRLASQLGLVNPASVAWELVPFSFLVDWFVNVGDYLEQFSDTAGMAFVMPWHGYKATSRVNNVYSTSGPGGWDITSDGFVFERFDGLPGVSFRFRSPWVISPTRALTAISLLVQQGLR